jgi:hypothetical protein
VTGVIDIVRLNVQPSADARQSEARRNATKRLTEEEITTADDSGSSGKKLKE